MNTVDFSQPVFGNWYIDEEIGSGAFGTVYKIKREEYGNTYYSALKVIRIPSDSNEIDTLRSEGMDELSITSYYKEIVQSLVNEINILDSLKGNSNIVSYEDHEILSDESGKNYTILIRMELLTPLKSFMLEQKMNEEQITKLGMDLCSALILCEKNRIIHRDIKPDNIFVSKNGDYKLGDFGVARTVEKTMSQMSRKGTCTYMAPEVYLNQSYDKRADIYSLGIVLYQLLNNNRGPFLPPAPEPIRFSDRERATELRVKGEGIPELNISNKKLARVVEKACSFKAEERQKDATEFFNQLKASTEEDNSVVEQSHLVPRETTISLNNSHSEVINNTSSVNEQDDLTVSPFLSNTGNAENQAPVFTPANTSINNQTAKQNYAMPNATAGDSQTEAPNNNSVPDEQDDLTVSPFSNNTGNAGNKASVYISANADVSNQTTKQDVEVPRTNKGDFSSTALDKTAAGRQVNSANISYVNAPETAEKRVDGLAPVKENDNNKNSFFNPYSNMLKNYATFKGRISKTEFCKAMLVHFLMAFLLFLFAIFVTNYASILLFAIYILATIVPVLSIQTRRLHDAGKNGKYNLLVLIPFIGPIILFYFLLQQGNVE